LKFFRKELYFPKIIDRTNYAGWEKLGSKTMDVKLQEKTDEILSTHKAEAIEPAAAKQIEQILKNIQR
jgi:trimethylamine:corrinoid methyltransferase-like protein